MQNNNQNNVQNIQDMNVQNQNNMNMQNNMNQQNGMQNQNPVQNNVPNNFNMNIENTRMNPMPGQNPYINQNMNPNGLYPTQNKSLLNNGDLVKGALIGAAVTFLLTNKSAQNTIMGALGKGSELFQAGMEELKERYEDMKAQNEAN